MRLTITSAKEQHAESCTVIAVSLSGEILSGSDDFSVRRWSASGEALGVVKQFESGVTAVAWVPVSGAARRTRGAAAGVSAEAKDNCIVACADGTFCFLNAATGRVERTVEAHVGSITSLVYAVDGSSILTAGEDGCIKVWSQAGIPRSTLANAGKCVYALCWGMETTELGGECVLYTTGTDVVIKPMNPTIKKTNRWKAHNGVVLCADWSRMSGLIVTGGEDGVFKVWDPHGRNVFTSAPGKQPITSVKFSADGDTFAVGSFMNVRICDKTGWSHTYERLGEGSAMAIQWMPDGTQLAIGGGTGALCLAQLVDRKISWGSYTVSQTESRKLLVHDVATDRIEEIVQKDTIIKVEIGYGYIVVCTTTLCACYNVLRLDSPVLLDLRDAVITLKLGPKLFMVADCSQGIQLFSYEGRPVSVLRLQASLRPDILISDLLSVSADTVVMRSPTDRHRILFFDVNSGKQLEDLTIVHHVDIISVHLSQSGTQFNRKIAFVDRNQDLYFSAVHKKSGLQKMSTMTSSVCWHDEHEILIAICDGRLTCWYYPSILFIDPDLIPQVKHVRDEANEEFSRNDNIVGFHEARVQVRRGGDGALLTLPVSPFPSILFKLVESNKWSSASRLVCFLDDQLLWAVLAGQALIKEELNIAEICYGALFDLAKVRYIHALKLISSPVLRQAKLALLQHRTTDAERVAIEGGLPLFAMEMLADLCNVSRVRELGKEMRVSDIVVDLMLHGDRRLWRLLELRRIFMKEQLNHPIRGSRMEPHVNELFFWFCSSQKGKHSFSKDFTSLENISKNLYGEDERIDHAVAGPVRASISDALNLPTGEDASIAVKKIRRIKQMATNPAIEEEEKKDLVDLVVWFRDYPLSFEGLRDLKEFGVDISEKLFTDSDSTLRDTLVQRVNFALELLKGEGDK